MKQMTLERAEELMRPLEDKLSSRSRAMGIASLMGAAIVERGFGKVGINGIEVKKADNTIVTKYDFESQKVMLEILRARIPGAAIITEEKTADSNRAFSKDIPIEKIIYIDPLDGTAPFARGVPGSSVTAACDEEGAIAIPSERVLLVGDKDAGVYRICYGGTKVEARPQKVHVSNGNSSKLLCAMDLVIRVTTSRQTAQFITELPDVTGKNWSFAVGSNVTNGGRVADGRLEFALLTAKGGDFDFNGHRLTKLAGGFACDQDGNEITASSECGLAVCTEELRDKLVKVTSRAFAGYRGFAPKS